MPRLAAAIAALLLAACHDGPLGGNRQLEPPVTQPQIRVVKRTACISEGSEAMTVCEVVVTTVNNDTGADVQGQCFVASDEGWRRLDAVQGSFTQPLKCAEGGMDYDEEGGGVGPTLMRARPVRLPTGLALVREPYAVFASSGSRSAPGLDAPPRSDGRGGFSGTEPRLIIASLVDGESEVLRWAQLVEGLDARPIRDALPTISAANPSAALFVQPSPRLFYVSRDQRLISAALLDEAWSWHDAGLAGVAQVEAAKSGGQLAVAWARTDGNVELGLDGGIELQRLTLVGYSAGAFAMAAAPDGVAFVLRSDDGALWLQTADLTGRVGARERIPTDGATQPSLVVHAGVPTVSFVEETADGPVTVVAEKKSSGWVRTVLQ